MMKHTGLRDFETEIYAVLAGCDSAEKAEIFALEVLPQLGEYTDTELVHVIADKVLSRIVELRNPKAAAAYEKLSQSFWYA